MESENNHKEEYVPPIVRICYVPIENYFLSEKEGNGNDEFGEDEDL